MLFACPFRISPLRQICTVGKGLLPSSGIEVSQLRRSIGNSSTEAKCLPNKGLKVSHGECSGWAHLFGASTRAAPNSRVMATYRKYEVEDDSRYLYTKIDAKRFRPALALSQALNGRLLWLIHFPS
jgi:hypothetical protein